MNEIIYTSYSQLGSPRIFLNELGEDLRKIKDLGWRLFVTNLRSQYRQSWLSYLWLLFPPILTMFIWFYLSKANILNSNVAENIYPLYVLSGIFIWQIFVECLNCPIQQLTASKWILSKVKVPHEAFIIAGLGGIIFNSIIRLTILAIALLFFGMPLKFTLFLVPFGIILVGFLGLAIGLAITPLGMLYSDIQNGLNLIVSLWFFITPIIYAESGIWWINKFNPVAPLLITARNWILTDKIIPERGFFLITFFSIVLLIFGWLFYRLAKPHLILRFSS